MWEEFGKTSLVPRPPPFLFFGLSVCVQYMYNTQSGSSVHYTEYKPQNNNNNNNKTGEAWERGYSKTVL